MTTIKMSREWKLGKQFNKGGMGRVFEALADDGSPAVIKLIPKYPGGDRELLFKDLSRLPNVIPIFDTGEWQDSWVIVMPRAEKSLAKHLADRGGQLSLDEAMPILIDVAQALAALETDVVHRDLKPDNILFYQGKWCIADFGIARYAEATTAADTHKFAKTPAYAAPEQWREEHATNATDVYAFDVISFELTQGRLPFQGPDLREQHLHETPPALNGCPSTLASLVIECLYKVAEARPTPANILARLRAVPSVSSPAASKLQDVQKKVAQQRAEEAARLSAAQTRDERRRQLYETAKPPIDRVVDNLVQRIIELAPASQIEEISGRYVLTLGEGKLLVDQVMPAPPDCLQFQAWPAPFDVVAHSAIRVEQQPDRTGYQGRSHSLWFCDAQDENAYRWYELGFILRNMSPERFSPTALPPDTANARQALSPAPNNNHVGWEPAPFDQGDEEDFIERWMEWFAAAADGSLTRDKRRSGGRRRRAS
jgi:eukaryotic-like serine/threonine-protein kinase